MTEPYFDTADFKRFCRSNPRYGYAYNEPLYFLFGIDRDHRDSDAVAAKVTFIDKMYLSNIGNYVAKTDAKPPGIGATNWLAEELANDERMKRIMRRAKSLALLSASTVDQVVEHVEDYVDLIKSICGKEQSSLKGPNSFCSKYLHFHTGVTPIYDNDASNVLHLIYAQRAWKSVLRRRPPNKKFTNELTYREVAERSLHLLEAAYLRRRFSRTQVKRLDHYLIACYRKEWQ